MGYLLHELGYGISRPEPPPPKQVLLGIHTKKKSTDYKVFHSDEAAKEWVTFKNGKRRPNKRIILVECVY